MISFLTVFFITFGLIFIAELGDKTQLMVFTLALRFGGKPVLAGAFLAFALLSGSAAVIGRGLGEMLSPGALARISAWVFILFGASMLLLREKTEPENPESTGNAGFAAAFSLIALSEMGDKTQVATLLLSIKYQSFFSVFLGSLAGLTLSALLGILIAGRLHRFIPAKYITPVSGLLFILLGVGTLVLSS